MIMLKAAGIGPGDEVIVPAHTFIATALAVEHAGATPVCAEVEEGTGLIDPDAVRAAIGPRTAAVLPVHLYGQVCRMDELRELADGAGLALFEDAAQAHGAAYQGRRAGALGRAGAFSFYPSKNLGALGDGGAICTDDDELAATARRFRDLGRLGGQEHTVRRLQRAARRPAGRVPAGQARPPRRITTTLAASARRAYREQLDGAVQLLEDARTRRASTTCSRSGSPTATGWRPSFGLAGSRPASIIRSPCPTIRRCQSCRRRDTPIARDWARRELSLPIFPEITRRRARSVVAAVHRTSPSLRPKRSENRASRRTEATCRSVVR